MKGDKETVIQIQSQSDYIYHRYRSIRDLVYSSVMLYMNAISLCIIFILICTGHDISLIDCGYFIITLYAMYIYY